MVSTIYKAINAKAKYVLVILHKDESVVQRCRDIISEWLKGMSLELKPSKTRLIHTLDKYEGNDPGFDFLGFHIRQYKVSKYHSGKDPKGELLGFKPIITPSKEKQKAHYDQVCSVINAHKSASQLALITNLNPIIRGWANYYSSVCSKETYSQLDSLTYQKLFAWAKRRHPNKSARWIVSKYWQTIGNDNWAFANRQQGKNPKRLLRYAATPIVRHIKVKGDASPYDGNLVYWSTRMGKHPEATTRVATLLKKQKGKCAHCGMFFKDGDVLEVDHKIPKSKGGKDEYKNLQMLHRHCHDSKTANDDKAKGMHLDKHHVIEEPDEGKLSRPVLKPSRPGDGAA